ncbi:unnamed protein product [Arctogadus glacialis]
MAGEVFGAERKTAVNTMATTDREWRVRMKRSKEWVESSWKSVISIVHSRQAHHKCRFTTVNGLNLNADNDLVEKLKAKGHTQGESSDPCEYILAFCPISTRPGIDIQETMEMCTGDKPVILVVLHHTHDREKNVSPHRVDPSQPFKDKIVLSVACLFYEGKLLKCKHNDKEIDKVIDHLSHPNKAQS